MAVQEPPQIGPRCHHTKLPQPTTTFRARPGSRSQLGRRRRVHMRAQAKLTALRAFAVRIVDSFADDLLPKYAGPEAFVTPEPPFRPGPRLTRGAGNGSASPSLLGRAEAVNGHGARRFVDCPHRAQRPGGRYHGPTERLRARTAPIVNSDKSSIRGHMSSPESS